MNEIYKIPPNQPIRILEVWSDDGAGATAAGGEDIATMKGSAINANAGLVELYPNVSTTLVYYVLDNDTATASTASAVINHSNPLRVSPAQAGTAGGAAVVALHVTAAARITGIEYEI